MSDPITNEISNLQTQVIVFIDTWTRTVKTSVPQKEIMKAFKTERVKDYMVTHALKELLKKGYIRRAVMISNRTAYVQVRTIDREAVIV